MILFVSSCCLTQIEQYFFGKISVYSLETVNKLPYANDATLHLARSLVLFLCVAVQKFSAKRGLLLLLRSLYPAE